MAVAVAVAVPVPVAPPQGALSSLRCHILRNGSAVRALTIFSACVDHISDDVPYQLWFISRCPPASQSGSASTIIDFCHQLGAQTHVNTIISSHQLDAQTHYQ